MHLFSRAACVLRQAVSRGARPMGGVGEARAAAGEEDANFAGSSAVVGHLLWELAGAWQVAAPLGAGRPQGGVVADGGWKNNNVRVNWDAFLWQVCMRSPRSFGRSFFVLFRTAPFLDNSQCADGAIGYETHVICHTPRQTDGQVSARHGGGAGPTISASLRCLLPTLPNTCVRDRTPVLANDTHRTSTHELSTLYWSDTPSRPGRGACEGAPRCLCPRSATLVTHVSRRR